MTSRATATRPATAQRGGVQSPAQPDGRRSEGRRALGYWPLVVVLLAYIGSALVVPTLANVPIGDDWAYARSVEILLHQHQLRILNLTVVTLVFQVFWGALFATLFGLGFGALRLSTVVLVGAGAVALYGICRELGVGRRLSALGAAIYLFNPLSFALAFTFMSDAPFTALMLLSTFGYLRGLREEAIDARWTLLGSLLAGLAFLTRQQGVLIPLAAALALAADGRLRPNRRALRPLLLVGLVPGAIVILYYAWLKLIHGVPYYQTAFSREVIAAGAAGTWQLVRRMAFIEPMYVGFFALPAALMLLPRLPQLLREQGRVSRPLLGGLLFGLAVGIAVFTREGYQMPYIPQYFGAWGLGPQDILGDDTLIARPEVWGALTFLSAAGVMILALALVPGLATPRRRRALGPTFLITLTLLQVLGSLPASFHFLYLPRTPSMDRYLLPLLPLVTCLALWSLREVAWSEVLGWLAVGLMLLVAVAGTRDMLVFQQATWDLARQANALGIADAHLDAGASWDGYHLYDDSNFRQEPRTPDGPWWTSLFAPRTDSAYVVATRPLTGDEIVARVEYSSWLQRRPLYLYLERNPHAPSEP